MCRCALEEGIHWYVDRVHAPYLYQIASSPEEAESILKQWAAKILSVGHNQLDIRQTAGKILALKTMRMEAICDRAYLFHPSEALFE